MPKSCCAFGCQNHNMKLPKMSFYGFPKDPERREKWINAVNRVNTDGTKWMPKLYTVICGAHFLLGKPSDDKTSQDYVPTLFPIKEVQNKNAYRLKLSGGPIGTKTPTEEMASEDETPCKYSDDIQTLCPVNIDKETAANVEQGLERGERTSSDTEELKHEIEQLQVSDRVRDGPNVRPNEFDNGVIVKVEDSEGNWQLSTEQMEETDVHKDDTDEKMMINPDVPDEESSQLSRTSTDGIHGASTYDDIHVKTIDVNEDDDLFDFLKDDPPHVSDTLMEDTEKQQITEEEIRGRELYRYLTVQDPTKLRSLQVTPDQSSVDSDSDSSSTSGSTDHMDSSSDVEQEEQPMGGSDNEDNGEDIQSARRVYSAEKRVEVAKYGFQVGAAKASRIYRIPKTTVQNWMKNENCGMTRTGVKLGRPFSYPIELESQVKYLVLEQLDNRRPVSMGDVKTFGHSIIDPVCPDFKASRSWALGFLKRGNLVFDGRYVHVEGEEIVHQTGENVDDYQGSADEDSNHHIEPVAKVRRKPGPKPRIDRVTKKKLEPGQLSTRTLERLEKCKENTNKWLKDLEVPELLTTEAPLAFDIVDLNQHLTCGLCKGYLYEASTITECMHTFCKNCIVRHCMEVSLHCPVCNILIHPTDPFIHIRLDRMIQDIVYKILPNVAETEMKHIEEFYEAHPEVEPKEIQQPPPKPRVSPRDKDVKTVKPELVSLVLELEDDEYLDSGDSEELFKKFVRVTSMATIDNVCNFLRKKLNLQSDKEVQLFCCGDAIEERSYTLENIKHRFFGEEECMMLLQYRVLEI